MADVFGTEASVFFVGGPGLKFGDPDAGGCSRQWYESSFTQLTDIMGPDGQPLVDLHNQVAELLARALSASGAD